MEIFFSLQLKTAKGMVSRNIYLDFKKIIGKILM
jgi:hypothetical protein